MPPPKPGADNGRVPKWTAAQADVQKCGDGMNRDGPNDGNEYERYVEPFRRTLLLIPAVEQISAYVDIEQEISIEHDHVPAQHGGRKIELAYAGDQMPEPVGAAKVHRHKQE